MIVADDTLYVVESAIVLVVSLNNTAAQISQPEIGSEVLMDM